MGSAVPCSYESDPARSLLVEIETVNRLSTLKTGQENWDAARQLLLDALDDLSIRERVIAYLAAYLSRTTTGNIPDHRLWIP